MNAVEYLEQTFQFKTLNAQKALRTVLRIWLGFLGETKLVDATTQDAIVFLAELKRARLADRTVKQRYQLLRAMYNVLLRGQYVEKNIFIQLVDLMPRRQSHEVRPTRMLTCDEVLKILNAPDPASHPGVRDRALLAVLFGAGLRRSEARKLNLADIRFDGEKHPYLFLRQAKAGVDQRAAIGPWVLAALSDLLSQRRGDGAGPDDPLFCFYFISNKARGRLSDRTIARIFQRHAVAAGIVGQIAPHSARATAASTLIDLGIGDRAVAEFLRHASVEMVRVYDRRAFGPRSSPARRLDYRKKAVNE